MIFGNYRGHQNSYRAISCNWVQHNGGHAAVLLRGQRADLTLKDFSAATTHPRRTMKQQVKQGFVCTSSSISSYTDCQMGGDTTNQQSHVLPCLAPSTYPHPASHISRARSQHMLVEAGHGADHSPKAACVENGTSPPEKDDLPLTISCKSGKGREKQDWEKPCMTKVILQGYVFILCTQGGEARGVHAHIHRQEVPPAFTSIC